MSKVFAVKLPDELAAKLEAVIGSSGKTVNAWMREHFAGYLGVTSTVAQEVPANERDARGNPLGNPHDELEQLDALVQPVRETPSQRLRRERREAERARIAEMLAWREATV